MFYPSCLVEDNTSFCGVTNYFYENAKRNNEKKNKETKRDILAFTNFIRYPFPGV